MITDISLKTDKQYMDGPTFFSPKMNVQNSNGNLQKYNRN